MLKYLFLLLPLWSFGQITSYTSTQTGVGNAAVYWPAGATDVVVVSSGLGWRGTNASLLYNYKNPLVQIRDEGWRPEFAVIGIQALKTGGEDPVSMMKFIKWIFKTFPAKRWSGFGFSMGAADWYHYVKQTAAADYIAPYSLVLMSITADVTTTATCKDLTSICPGTNDERFKNIKVWAMCGREDSHHDKQKRFTDAMIKAGYPAKWTTFTGEGHCCWDKRYNRNWTDGKESIYQFALPPAAEPEITVNAGSDTTIYFPQDSFRLKPSGVPVGADVGWQIKSGPGKVVNGVLGPIYKSQTTVTLFVSYNSRTYTDDVVITAVYDPYVTLTVLDIGDATDPKKRLKLAIDVSGRLSWLLQ